MVAGGIMKNLVIVVLGLVLFAVGFGAWKNYQVSVDPKSPEVNVVQSKATTKPSSTPVAKTMTAPELDKDLVNELNQLDKDISTGNTEVISAEDVNF